MSFQGGVDLPESEQVLLGEDSNLTQGSVKDGASVTLKQKKRRITSAESTGYNTHLGQDKPVAGNMLWLFG